MTYSGFYVIIYGVNGGYMKNTKNTYRNGLIADIEAIDYYNKCHVSYDKYRTILKNNSMDVINTYTGRSVNVPIIIKCAFDGTDYSFYEFITGEEYHKIHYSNALLKGENGNLKITLAVGNTYDSESLVRILSEMNDDEKAAYIYGMEQLPVILKDRFKYESLNKKEYIEQINEDYLDEFVKRYRK